MDKKNVIQLDSVFEEFDFMNIEYRDDNKERFAITIWMPLEYYEKYNSIQRQSRKKFGKLLKEVIKRSIDKVFSQYGLMTDRSA